MAAVWSLAFGAGHYFFRRDAATGVIEVKTGHEEGLTSGKGQILRCKKKGQKFEVIDVLTWVS